MNPLRPTPTLPRLSALMLVLAGALLVMPLASRADAYPEPEVVSPSWQLEFTWRKPRAIALQTTDGSYRWFWYMPYKVVNDTGSEVLFIPEITIATDTGRIISAGQDVPASLFPKIKDKLDNPLLQSPIDVVGELLQGEDHAKESVAIWPAFEKNVTHMKVFVAGLSGETQTFEHPTTGEPVMVRRTLMLHFRLPGDPPTPQGQPVVHVDQREVMR